MGAGENLAALLHSYSTFIAGTMTSLQSVPVKWSGPIVDPLGSGPIVQARLAVYEHDVEPPLLFG